MDDELKTDVAGLGDDPMVPPVHHPGAPMSGDEADVQEVDEDEEEDEEESAEEVA